ncbi:MAG TPA: hypothetical protein VF789_05075 [Thermoanaerobaculia bacterium]
MDHRIFSLFVGGAGLLFLVWLSYLSAQWARRTAEMRHELRLRVLERFSSEEMVTILQSEGGRAWMADVLTGRPEVDLMTGTLKQAILLTFIGLALGIGAAVTDTDALAAICFLVMAGAAALWVATWIAHRRGRRARLQQAAAPPQGEGQ